MVRQVIWDAIALVIVMIFFILKRLFTLPQTLTYKHLQTHGCVLSTVATNTLALKHNAIIIHNADVISIALDKFQTYDDI